MPTTFENMIASGLAAVQTVTGETVTYTRGGDTVSITATKGKAELNIDRMTTVLLEGIDASWICADADLKFTLAFTGPDGPGETVTKITPQRNDRITQADGTIWEVTPFGEIGCYRLTAGVLRIFVKAVAA